MPVPKYNEMYRELLMCLSDGREHKSNELKDSVAKLLNLTESDRAELLPSGQSVYDNRIAWAKTYLKKAGLLENAKRGVYIITNAGRTALSENPNGIDNAYLQKFESFREFASHNSDAEENTKESKAISDKTPQDIIGEAFNQINDALIDDVLTNIKEQSPAFFERLVVKLLIRMGYGAVGDGSGLVVGKTGDEGIDGIIQEDKLGFDHIYIQAKRWDRESSIGRQEIQRFVGALAGKGASKGLFITTAKFTDGARDFVEKQHTTKIVLVDGATLAKLMIEYDLGVYEETTYRIKRIDNDFFMDDLV